MISEPTAKFLTRTWWRERARAVRAELAAARGDRRKAFVLAAVVVIGVGSCGAGAALGAWTQACSGGCPTSAQIEDLAPQRSRGRVVEIDGVWHGRNIRSTKGGRTWRLQVKSCRGR